MSRAAYEMTPRLVRGTWVSGGAAVEFSSTAPMMRAMVRTASSGYLPTEVSPGQHDRVGAVEHGVGDVGGLGPGGAGVLDHRLEHLGGHDHRLGVLAAI